MAFSVVMIAGIFFLVTMGLAVGPLLLCRLFVGSSESCPPQRRRHPFMAGIMTACGFMVAVVVGMVLIYLSFGAFRQITAIPLFSSWSLFDGVRSPFDPVSTSYGLRYWVSLGSMLMPWVAIAALVALACGGPRGVRLRIAVMTFFVALGLAMLIAERHERLASRAQIERTAKIAQTQRLVEQHLHATTDQSTTDRAGYRLLNGTSTDAATSKAFNVAHPRDADGFAAPGDDEGVVTAAVQAEEHPDDSSAADTVVEYTGTTAIGVPRDTLPDWVSGQVIDGTIHVIKSGPHATVELAEQQALADLKSQLMSEFASRHPEASHWRPSDELVLHSGSILRRAVERSEITVGEFTTPMYESYWLVDPTIGAGPLENAWRPSVVKQRLIWLGGGIGLLTLLLGSLAAGLRFDEQTEGKRRTALTLGALAVWAVAGGAVLLVAWMSEYGLLTK